MEYYGVGFKKQQKKSKNSEAAETTGSGSVRIPLTETSRVLAVKQAERIAKRDGIELQAVYALRNAR
jgi:hypothetical protein